MLSSTHLMPQGDESDDDILKINDRGNSKSKERIDKNKDKSLNQN